jgi:hypothetical protein
VRQYQRRKVSHLTGKEKGPENFFSGPSSYRILVRLAGIEPTTPWFVAKYSIQLSYSRAGKHYSSFVSFSVVRISRRLHSTSLLSGLAAEEAAL